MTIREKNNPPILFPDKAGGTPTYDIGWNGENDIEVYAESSNEVEEGLPKIASKFDSYALPVDPLQGDKATQINLCSVARPHMRAFHFAWWSYHVAFLMW